MKSFLAALGLGLVALILQGALARALPPPWCPDLAWLVVVALGLRWPGFLSGLLLAVLLGYAMDIVSGSLMGQHALLRLLTYLVAALASRQLDLSGALPVSLFVFVLTGAYGLAITASLSFFVGSTGPGLFVLGQALCQALVHAVAIHPVLGLVDRLRVRLSEEELGRRSWPVGFERGRV